VSLKEGKTQVLCSINFELVVHGQHLEQQSMIINSLLNVLINQSLEFSGSIEVSLILTIVIEGGKDLPSSQDLIDLEQTYDLVSVRVKYSSILGNLVFV